MIIEYFAIFGFLMTLVATLQFCSVHINDTYMYNATICMCQIFWSVNFLEQKTGVDRATSQLVLARLEPDFDGSARQSVFGLVKSLFSMA